jgi:Amt family ammonium transporter
MDTGHAAWLLTSASLVLLMTPGLALFYGGMTRVTSVLNMMLMSFGAMGAVVVVYVLWGWSMSYGPDLFGDGATGLLGNPFDQFGLSGTPSGDLVTVGFQMTFAVIAAALVSGAVADRTKFSTWMVFVPLWVTLCYFPLAHMVWGGGFLSGSAGALADRLQVAVAPIDYAGGTVVHINAGMAGLVLALLLGSRHGFGTHVMRPHNVPLTMLGAGLRWFGWYGFNVGSFVPSTPVGVSGPADGFADRSIAFATSFAGETGLVWVNTTAAAAAGMLGWLLYERLREGRSTSLGAASGVVAGLVAVTPACGAVSPVGALLLGAGAGVACAGAVGWKFRLGYDDSLDVVGVHLVGGLVGTVGVGALSTSTGLLYGHGTDQLLVQTAVALFAIAWSGLFTLVVGLALKAVMGWRVTHEHEVAGVDSLVHGETAYDFLFRPVPGVAWHGALGAAATLDD